MVKSSNFWCARSTLHRKANVCNPICGKLIYDFMLCRSIMLCGLYAPSIAVTLTEFHSKCGCTKSDSKVFLQSALLLIEIFKVGEIVGENGKRRRVLFALCSTSNGFVLWIRSALMILFTKFTFNCSMSIQISSYSVWFNSLCLTKPAGKYPKYFNFVIINSKGHLFPSHFVSGRFDLMNWFPWLILLLFLICQRG